MNIKKTIDNSVKIGDNNSISNSVIGNNTNITKKNIEKKEKTSRKDHIGFTIQLISFFLLIISTLIAIIRAFNEEIIGEFIKNNNMEFFAPLYDTIYIIFPFLLIIIISALYVLLSKKST